MARDERTGLILLIAFLLLAGVLLGAATNSGQAVTNIFSNLINNVDDPHSPAIQTQLDTIKEEVNPYWMIGVVAALTSVVSLVSVWVYMSSRRRIPRSWSLFLLLVGMSAIPLELAAAHIQTELLDISGSQVTYNSEWDGLQAGVGLLKGIALLEGAAVLIGLVLLVWSLVRKSRSES